MVTALPLSPSASKVSRNAGSRRGSLSAFTPPLAHSLEQQILERVLAQGRSSDLAVNDWAAHSGINSIATCAVGTGLTPQSRIDYKRLGVSPEAARRLQSDIEAVWGC